MLNGAEAKDGGPSRPLPGANWALALLLAINLFNYIDRQILSATLEKISLDATIFAPQDPNQYLKLGMLTTAFMVSYMCLSPLFGRWGDTFARWKLIGIGVIVWSLATGGTGLATGYLVLFLTRCLVGIGEAAYGPVAPAMLSDLYPVDHRGRVLSWFYMAIPVGSALGFVIGAQVAETALGWRWAFFVAVIPGILLGLLCFFMKEPPRRLSPVIEHGNASERHTPELKVPRQMSYWTVLNELKLNRSFVLCCAGMTASTFVLGGVATVMQLYLVKREARFIMNEQAVDKLKELRRSDGTPVMPDEVIARLSKAASPDLMTTDEFQSKLKGTKGSSALLSDEELENYQIVLFRACPAPGSLTNGAAGLYIGAIVVLSGLVATLLGGILGDYLRNRGVRGAYFLVAGWGMIAAFPFFLGMLYTSINLTWLLLFGAVFFLFFNTGPANTILANVVSSKIRATAFAINILIIHALGDAISPAIIGFVADRSSLQLAFVGVSFLIPVSGILWIWGARYLDEDTRKAESAQ